MLLSSTPHIPLFQGETMPPKRTLYLSALVAGEVYAVKTATCEYWLIMTEKPHTAELWYRADPKKNARRFGVVTLPQKMTEGESCAIKDSNGKMHTTIIFLPMEVRRVSIEDIPVDASCIA